MVDGERGPVGQTSGGAFFCINPGFSLSKKPGYSTGLLNSLFSQAYKAV